MQNNRKTTQQQIGNTVIDYMVTHPGPAHRDELLAIAMLLALNGEPLSVYRRNPTETELAAPQVAVIDCGGMHDPKVLNFDHHQYPGGDCSFLLVMKALGHHDVAAELFPWYGLTNDFDVLGPHATLKKLGVSSDTAGALRSPFEEGVLRLFGQMEEVEPWLLELLTQIGRGIINKIFNLLFRMRELEESASILTVHGVRGILSTIERDPSLGLNSYRTGNYPDAAFSICPDYRGSGYILYRFDNDEHIDFRLLMDDDRISFAHKGGFVAKTKEREPIESLLNLIEKSIVVIRPNTFSAERNGSIT